MSKKKNKLPWWGIEGDVAYYVPLQSPGVCAKGTMNQQGSNIKPMAKDTANKTDASWGTKSASAPTSASDNSGTELKTFSFIASEDAVVPDGWEIVSVNHDRLQGTTNVVAKRPYDKERAAKERAEVAGDSAVTPTYPQTAGAVNAPAQPPVTSFPWGSIDTSKVQNIDTIKQLPGQPAGEAQPWKDTPAAALPAAAVDSPQAKAEQTHAKPGETAAESAAVPSVEEKAKSDKESKDSTSSE